MRTRATTRRFGAALALALAAALAGCAHTEPLTYRPGPPAAGAARLPVRLAVLPLQDGTEDFTKEGSVFQPETLRLNLVKGGVAGTLEPVTPPMWSRALAAELDASGRFRSARFVYEAAEAVEEDLVVSGTIRRAYAFGSWDRPGEFEVELRATRRQGGAPAWTRTVIQRPVGSRASYDACGASVSCVNQVSHAHLNATLRAMFEEAGADLARALSGGRPAPQAAPAGQPAAAPPPERVEDTIQRILDGR